jgi:hypothetical protein
VGIRLWRTTSPSAPDHLAVFFAQYVRTHEREFDVIIFGRGRALRSDPDRPGVGFRQVNYARVIQTEFPQGRLRDGISLKRLIETIGERWFDRTRGNPDYRTVYRNRKHIPISVDTLTWLNEQLDERLRTLGATQGDLNQADDAP